MNSKKRQRHHVRALSGWRHATILSAALLLLAGCAGSPQETPTPPAAGTTERNDLHHRTFEKVWTEIQDHYYDPEFGGLDWNAIGDRYRAKLGSLTSDDALHTLLHKMVSELGQSHLAVIPPGAYVSFESDEDAASSEEGPGGAPGSSKSDQDEKASPSTSKKRGHVGLEASMVEGRLTIVSVDKGGPAETAGLKPGFVILDTDGRDIGKVISRLTNAGRDDPTVGRSVEQLVAARLRGAPDSSVTISYLDGENTQHEVTVVRAPDDLRRITILNLPPIAASCDVRTLEGGIGYVSFSIFFLQLMEEIRTGVLSFRDAPGLILDLRGNGGGIAFMAVSVAALLFDERTDLGRMRGRDNRMRFPVFPVSDPVRAPVVILVDGGSASTSEMLAGSLQEMGRVQVIGTPTAGMVLPSILKTLPTRARLQYPMMDFVTPKGHSLEGAGVIPDFIIPFSRASLLSGQDNVLEAARKLLLDRRPPPERIP